jgi:Winged helix DNA-binding domain
MAAVAADVLTRRELNRATLARQLLLERSDLPVLEAVEHLVGLQAQVPRDPYTALWSRLAGFRPDELSRLLVDRKLVRIAVMRSTIHLVSADDCLVLRPLVQPVLDGELSRHRDYGPALVGVDLDAVMDVARPLLASRAMTGAQLRAALAERFPGLDPAALAFACRNRLAFVQVPPRGLWGRSGQVTSTTAESWLGRPLDPAPSIDEVVMRYLAAFGPAAVADVTTWSRLTGLREVVDRLRPRLRPFRDEHGRELFDLPDAPRPGPDTPAPARFLPEYDNALLSHADRSRFMSDDHRKRLSYGPGPIHGSVLHDSVGCATWHIDRDPASGKATLVVDHLDRLTKRAASTLAAEGRRLLRFLASDADTHDVRFAALD